MHMAGMSDNSHNTGAWHCGDIGKPSKGLYILYSCHWCIIHPLPVN